MIHLKIKINYDLFDKINEANTGMSLKRITKKNLFAISITLPLMVATSPDLKTVLAITTKLTAMNYLFYGISEMLFSSFIKDKSKDELKKLAIALKNIDVNTDYEMLLNASKYKTEYEIKKDEQQPPKLEQKKYIMVPVYDNGEEKEVSLVQEHIIGTDEYHLSYGSPKKVLKLAPITA